MSMTFHNVAPMGVWHSAVVRRLHTLDMLPELRDVLLQLVSDDEAWMHDAWQWGQVISTIQQMFSPCDLDITTFAFAWAVMYAAIMRLDHLQDRDPEPSVLPTLPSPGAHYNLLLTYYVLATSLLDDLLLHPIPAHRIVRLHRFWSDMMLRTASGQHQDLLGAAPTSEEAPLDHYQRVAQAKTGSTFALAFGGTAMLLTDDAPVIEACMALGDIFGVLVQYHDDIHDGNYQPTTTLTFTQVWHQMTTPTSHAVPTPAMFSIYLYHQYQTNIDDLLTACPPPVQTGMRALFTRTFGAWSRDDTWSMGAEPTIAVGQ